MHQQKTKKRAFTLVELIIVITILAILATIGFVSFQSYLKSSRDSAKVTTLREIEKGLLTYQTKVGTYPDPDNSIDIIGVSNQGYVRDMVKRLANIISSDTTTNYTYSTTKNKLKYELGVYLEEKSSIYFTWMENAYAASNEYLNKYLFVIGDGVGILYEKPTNIPVQELYTGSLNLSTSTGEYVAQFKNTSTSSGSIEGTGTLLLNNILVVQGSCSSTTYNGYSIPTIMYNQNQTVNKSITGGTGSMLASCGSNGILTYGVETIICANGYLLQSGACALTNYTFSQTISTHTLDYNLKSAAIAAGWNQISPLIATVTINGGIYIGSSSTATYAFDTGNSFPVGTTITLVNNGYISGKGGDGGNYGPNNGGAGGPGLIARIPISITNNGTIQGGGGGGGAGQSPWGGGGGGAGYPGGNGGIGGGYDDGMGPNGRVGTISSGGIGGYYYGGAGGGPGASGGNSPTTGVGYGGGGGAAITGNANITWQVVGTRLGSIN